MSLPREGSLFVGEEGTVILPHVGNPMLFPVEKFGVTLSPGDATRRKRKLAVGEKDERKVAEIEVVAARNHYHDWVDAALGGPETTANFAYAGPLTEAVLIGTIATQVPGSKLVWDQATMRITNNEQAQALVSKPYRKGWTV
jgi:hypothetical protein